jgi:LuxR family glucitol operon transcriptional activator
VQSALKEVVTRPSSYLEAEYGTLYHSFTDVLPTVEPERVRRSVGFFLHCLAEEVINIPQLSPIYQVQLHRASLDQAHQMVDAIQGLQRDQRQWMTMLLETLTQSSLLLASSADQLTHAVLPKMYHNLPPLYGEFLGREKDVARVLQGLDSRWPLISIEGLGGMGKTTLANKIAHSCLPGPQAALTQPFEAVVWVSAKDRPEQKRWLNEVLDRTARVLGSLSIPKMPLEQKTIEVHQLLNRRTLIVLDNFETIEDSVLVSWLQGIPEPSKVLITSRSGQLRSAWNITLKGLEDPNALELVRNHAQRLGLPSIETAHEDALFPLVRVTGGNPKAIEMALGYVKGGRLSLDEVIEHLHAANKTVGLFDDLFLRAWQVMTRDAQHILLVAPFFEDSASKEALGAASGLTKYHLDTAVEELVELMLLDINEESVTSGQRYGIHPLTRAFASAQLRNAQEFEGQTRERWSIYYLDFASRHLVREQSRDRYWNTLLRRGFSAPIDQEWLNLRKLLVWADQERHGQVLIELMSLLVHYMTRRLLYSERLYYAKRAAEAADELGRKEDAALFRIDALGWILIEVGQLADAEREITMGLRIAQDISAGSSDASDLIALANTFLARVHLEQGNVAEASALINSTVSTPCKPVIRSHIDMAAGDIAYKKKENAKALKHYENALRTNLQFKVEGEDVELYYRLGLVYLASGDLVQAETAFNKALGVEQHDITIEEIYAKYGPARIAQVKGERDKARRLAQEALNDLSRSVPSHRLLNQIQDFLKNLEAD